MNFMKRIPIKYLGELHEIRLVNFYVDMEEVRPLVPERIRIRDFNGRALISMVNVMLRNMHPSFLPGALNFEYRHIAFRLLVDDSGLNGGEAKGIYFLRSFTDKNLIAAAGALLTDYRLEPAAIHNIDRMLELKQGERFLNYALDPGAVPAADPQLLQTVGALDRAYSLRDEELYMVRILRERWPLRPVECYLFETNFFKTAQLAGAFTVDETIRYEWLPAQAVPLCA